MEGKEPYNTTRAQGDACMILLELLPRAHAITCPQMVDDIMTSRHTSRGLGRCLGPSRKRFNVSSYDPLGTALYKSKHLSLNHFYDSTQFVLGTNY